MQEFWKFLVGEWYFAFPMIAMMVVAATLVIWRILLNYRADTNLNQFLPTFQDKLAKEGAEGALKWCKSQPGMIPSRLFTVGLETSKQGLAAMRRAMASVMELEIAPQLNYLLPTILAIGKIATMVGLLGTVISMINTFSKIQEMTELAAKEGGKQGIASQSGAIGLALFATAMGLVTAIPLVFAHVQFKAWIANFEVKMRYAGQKLLVLMQSIKASAAAPAPGPKLTDSSASQRRSGAAAPKVE